MPGLRLYIFREVILMEFAYILKICYYIKLKDYIETPHKFYGS
jgi:hypothetical protein